MSEQHRIIRVWLTEPKSTLGDSWTWIVHQIIRWIVLNLFFLLGNIWLNIILYILQGDLDDSFPMDEINGQMIPGTFDGKTADYFQASYINVISFKSFNMLGLHQNNVTKNFTLILTSSAAIFYSCIQYHLHHIYSQCVYNHALF